MDFAAQFRTEALVQPDVLLGLGCSWQSETYESGACALLLAVVDVSPSLRPAYPVPTSPGHLGLVREEPPMETRGVPKRGPVFRGPLFRATGDSTSTVPWWLRPR